MELQKVILYLEDVIKDNKELKYYQRRVELARDYFDFYTGNLDEKLKKMLTRETDDEFTQRKGLTNHVTKPNLNSTKLPFYKAARKKPMVKKIDYNKKEAAEKITEIETLLKHFNGDRSLDRYLEIMMVEFNMIDPNAFLIIEFTPNTELEKAKPYPFIAVSSEIVDYEYENGELNYVIVRLPIKFIDHDVENNGLKYTFYNGNETIVYEQVGTDYILDAMETRKARIEGER